MVECYPWNYYKLVKKWVGIVKFMYGNKIKIATIKINEYLNIFLLNFKTFVPNLNEMYWALSDIKNTPSVSK